jgi:hypothetical protein
MIIEAINVCERVKKCIKSGILFRLEIAYFCERKRKSVSNTKTLISCRGYFKSITCEKRTVEKNRKNKNKI